MPFVDRVDAGRRLAAELAHLKGEDVVVLGLPRGGVPVAAEVADALGAPLDVIIVRKLGVPWQPELGMGAIGEDGVRVVNPRVVAMSDVTEAQLASVEAAERVELERRAQRFRNGRPRVPLTGRTAVIVDDGIATGSTARAACHVARAHGAARVILAVPVAPPEIVASFTDDADEVVCVETPAWFMAIGEWYEDFTQTSDGQVVALLDRAANARRDREVTIDVGEVTLAGHLTIPEGAAAIVVFVHGSGSSRHSPRNRQVAAALNERGFATLLFDLLTPDEEHDRANVFDIELLAARLVEVTGWLRSQPATHSLAVAYFGASTGAGAALWASAEPGARVAAVVSRGGRPDLAGRRLPEVTAPTLLIVGGADDVVLELNREARAALRCECDLAVVPGATHLFEEPGALEQVAALAGDWFARHLDA